MADKKRYTWSEIERMMRKFNEDRGYTTKGNPEHITAVAVITQDSFNKEYSEIERSYKFTSDNKAFLPSQLSNSIFADCLDDKDCGVRLDWYLFDDWKVDYCYLLDE